MNGERFKPGFLKERAAVSAQEQAIDLAGVKGISPDLLSELGKSQEDIDYTKPSSKALWVGLGIMAASAAAWVAGTEIPKDLTVDQFFIDVFNTQLVFSPVKFSSNSIKDIEQNTAQLVGSLAFLYVFIRGIGSKAEMSVKNLGNKIALKDKKDKLEESVKRGEALINIGPGHAVIDLGTNGDSIGNALGERLGWTQNSIPILEGDENDSDSPLWVKVPNASQAIKREEFYASLERARFDRSAVFVLCPQNQEQAFLPDPINRSHFDLGTADVLKRIALIDEYCEEKGIPQKDVVIIGDKTVKSAVGPSYRDGDRKITTEFTFDQIIDSLRNRRSGKIILADPTEIALSLLSGADYNPDKLPLEFYEDPYSETRYGGRFIERCKAMGIDVIESAEDTRDSLKVVHGKSDVESVHAASLIDGNMTSFEGTVAVLTDPSKRVGGWQHSVVLSEVVTDWVCEKLADLNEGTGEAVIIDSRSSMAGL